jgi:integrase
VKLTPSTIAGLTLPAGIDDKIFFCEDMPGFGVRLRRSGMRSLVLQYAVAGKTRKIPLGPVADLNKARSTAKTLLAKIRLGGDPASEKAQARARAGETLGSLVKPFLLHQQTKPKPLKPRSLKESERHLLPMCWPLHALPITAVDRRTVAARLAAIAQDNGPAAANRARGTLGAFFTWAIREGLIDTNPVSLTHKAAENGPRSRVLTDGEIANVWQALGDDQYGTILRLLVLSGLRRGEIGELCWSEINFDSNLITIPPSRTKNGRMHLVPMSAPVRALLEAQPRRDDRDRVFTEPLWNKAKIELDQRIAEINGSSLEGWVVHDLRRVFSTTLHDKLGIAPHIVEVLLGHIGHRSGVAGTYNQATYLTECERALSRWADHVMAIVTGEVKAAQIIQLKRSA